eukprot:CAMPEP_0206391072 /NCGR_PEP_ID=MMETSP0294-20121207/19035_1 /ASSEMBLY_ACC=CAM_ASM_000327 /TAXON_ID=39354 /ORGANISM="Heterosigma akashiwo, Strain CCMP2393" /LENGTH=32 /DNA_ID= /DNA_START= /DNA_END= /DNA_ORIENTATION=
MSLLADPGGVPAVHIAPRPRRRLAPSRPHPTA